MYANYSNLFKDDSKTQKKFCEYWIKEFKKQLVTPIGINLLVKLQQDPCMCDDTRLKKYPHNYRDHIYATLLQYNNFLLHKKIDKNSPLSAFEIDLKGNYFQRFWLCMLVYPYGTNSEFDKTVFKNITEKLLPKYLDSIMNYQSQINSHGVHVDLKKVYTSDRKKLLLDFEPKHEIESLIVLLGLCGYCQRYYVSTGIALDLFKLIANGKMLPSLPLNLCGFNNPQQFNESICPAPIQLINLVGLNFSMQPTLNSQFSWAYDTIRSAPGCQQTQPATPPTLFSQPNLQPMPKQAKINRSEITNQFLAKNEQLINETLPFLGLGFPEFFNLLAAEQNEFLRLLANSKLSDYGFQKISEYRAIIDRNCI